MVNNEEQVTTVGENIKNFRTWRGVTQQDLADRLEKSKSVISNWEHGTNSPDVESCKKICQLLEVTPNELLGWEENKEYIKYINDQKEYDEELDALHKEAAKIFEQIKDLEQKKGDKIPRPQRNILDLFKSGDDLPFN